MTTPAPNLDARGLPQGYPFKAEYEITPREARERAARGEIVIVDVRLASEVEAAGIPGAIHVPLHDLEQRANEVPAGAEIAVLCHHGVRSLKGALALRAMGWPTAKSIAGGIEAWSLGADPSVPRYERSGAVVRLLRP